MTKKHYERIARAFYITKPLKLEGETGYQWVQCVAKMMETLKDDNPNFQVKKFAQECGWTEYDPK